MDSRTKATKEEVAPTTTEEKVDISQSLVLPSSAGTAAIASPVSLGGTPRETLVSVLSCILHSRYWRNRARERTPTNGNLITLFHTSRHPSIGITDYFKRFVTYAEPSNEALILSLVYINILLATRPTFIVNSLTIHRLLTTSLVCAAKFFDDRFYNNAYYARIGGIPLRELNSLEIEFLCLINFDLHVNEKSYKHFYNQLCSESLHQGCQCDYALMLPIPEKVDLTTVNISSYELRLFKPKKSREPEKERLTASASANKVTAETAPATPKPEL